MTKDRTRNWGVESSAPAGTPIHRALDLCEEEDAPPTTIVEPIEDVLRMTTVTAGLAPDEPTGHIQ